uniref:Phosphoglycerate mutase n=1 Tax=Alexandrium catenella TaxID=2925 RepID=A0A7S1WI57_ALECA|mmetsp:Transcript_6352/g.17063  ORF Transcript_6352/g.17063 Transcript_6352/m.17063 type:complete len:249 (+) Transcript_6352:78-824(+)
MAPEASHEQLSGKQDADSGTGPTVAQTAQLTIYMCRHGTTTWNLVCGRSPDRAKRWQGAVDTELAPQGVEQARAAAQLLGDRGLRVTRIFTSDLKRAQRTAEIYAEVLGCEVVVDPRLREPSLGKFEGMTKDAIYSEYAELFKQLASLEQEERLRAAYFDGLESPLDTSRRVEALAQELSAQDWARGATVLFVTHSKVLEAVLASVFGKFYEGIHTTTCAFFQWQYQEGAHEMGEAHKIDFHDYVVEQ